MVDSKDSKDSKDTKDTKDSKDTKDTKDSKDTKDIKDSKDTKDTKDSKDTKDIKDTKDTRDSKKDKKEKDKKDRAEGETKPKKDTREEILELTIEQIHRKYGRGSLMRLGSKVIAPIEAISTGSISLDLALGVKGVPRGRIVEIFGPESSGKTTLALHIIASVQKNGGNAAFIDAEHALDPGYASNLGVQVDSLLISQPDYGEQALEIAEMLVTSNTLDVIVVDSVAALVPKAELSGEMGDAQMGSQARLMSQALRKLAGAINKANTCLVFINQLREKVGVFFGNPETTPGGRALKFYSTVRIEIRKVGNIKKGDTIIGCRTRGKVVKNKVAPPFREAEFDVYFGKGISWSSDVLEQGVLNKLIEKSGSWFSYKDEKLGQGKENAIEYLEAHPELLAALTEDLLKVVVPLEFQCGETKLDTKFETER